MATITNFDCPGSTQTLYISKKWIVGIILIIITGGREVIFKNPPIIGMRICDKSWEVLFAKNSQKVAKMAKNDRNYEKNGGGIKMIFSS